VCLRGQTPDPAHTLRPQGRVGRIRQNRGRKRGAQHSSADDIERSVHTRKMRSSPMAEALSSRLWKWFGMA